MKGYSVDLRERVIGAVVQGQPRVDVAARFEVSVPMIERWVRLKCAMGGLARTDDEPRTATWTAFATIIWVDAAGRSAHCGYLDRHQAS